MHPNPMQISRLTLVIFPTIDRFINSTPILLYYVPSKYGYVLPFFIPWQTWRSPGDDPGSTKLLRLGRAAYVRT